MSETMEIKSKKETMLPWYLRPTSALRIIQWGHYDDFRYMKFIYLHCSEETK